MKRSAAIIILSLLWPVLSIFAGEGDGDPQSWITISEFSAVNDKGFSTLVEGLETRSDWIEIHNASRESINMDGWSLTDDPENLTLWPFPEIHIGPRQTVIVWASGIQAEDHPENWPYVDDLGYFHTNFKLSGEGDYLAIVSPDLHVVHEYASHSITEDVWGFPPQKEGVSYGLCEGEQAFLPLPTPGEINMAECLDQCQAPEFSDVGGTFVNSFVLELSCPTPNAEIYYKLDGAEPVDPGRGRRAIPVDPGHGRRAIRVVHSRLHGSLRRRSGRRRHDLHERSVQLRGGSQSLERLACDEADIQRRSALVLVGALRSHDRHRWQGAGVVTHRCQGNIRRRGGCAAGEDLPQR